MISISPQSDPPPPPALDVSHPPEPQFLPQQYAAPSFNRAMTRYADAYHVARVQTTIGNIIKAASIAIGGVIVAPSILSALSSLNSPPSLLGPAGGILGFGAAFIGVVVGCVIGGIGFTIGVVVSAQAQLIQATLDAAVNTSPFMNNDDKARVMSL